MTDKDRNYTSDKKRKHLVILGAGKPHFGNAPSALIETSLGGNQLQWLLAATQALVEETTFIGGYKNKDVSKIFAELTLINNPEWETTGSFGSLLKAPLDKIGDMIVSYSDILFNHSVANSIENENADIVVVYDSLWLSRYKEHEKADIENLEQINFVSGKVVELGYQLHAKKDKYEFIGMAWFSKNATDYLSSLPMVKQQEMHNLSLSEGIEQLRCSGLVVDGIDVEGNWTQLRNVNDIRNFVLRTKAETLNNLRGALKEVVVLDQINFSVSDWQLNNENILLHIEKMFAGKLLAVRSSASNEDGFKQSNAGAFCSKLNVKHGVILKDAINEVIASYEPAFEYDQVLVQPMLSNVKISGVVFSKTLVNQSPWYVLNFDNSSDTTSITSGNSENHRTTYIIKKIDVDNVNFDFEWQRKLIKAVIQLETLLQFDALDVEFAVDKEDQIYFLQARPLVDNVSKKKISDTSIYQNLEKAKAKWSSYNRIKPNIPHIFGVMPDWNPAEIIGISPGRLAKSLYGYLITTEIWAAQRAEFGYRDVRPQELIEEFCGRPYVNVNSSFESLIPDGLEDGLASRLLEFYLNWLVCHPELHDKVEFEVVPNCMTPNFVKWENRLSTVGKFDPQEINQLRSSLTEITKKAFKQVDHSLVQVDNLIKKFPENQNAKISSNSSHVLRILEDCKQYGTLPFAHLARCAFIAISLLKDAQVAGIISQNAVDSFLSSVNTVASDFNKDAFSVKNSELSIEEFVSYYGHLRPGTYDITFPRYKDDLENFIFPIIHNANEQMGADIVPTDWLKERNNFFKSLEDLGLPSDEKTVEDFLRKSISGREYAKFIFTRNLSEAIEEIARYGKNFGLNRTDLADLDLYDILNFMDDISIPPEKLRLIKEKIRQNQAERKISEVTELPPLISKLSDFEIFTIGAEQPNFIGSEVITAYCEYLTDQSSQINSELAGKIVVIPRADPGYDWLISCKIKGLITMFGGANSHMAIRCAELGITAAIGIGPKRYEAISDVERITIDPGNSLIRVL